MTFDDSTKTQVIIAASIIAGPGASEADVSSAASALIARLSPGSAIYSAFERVEKRDEATDKVKSFPATIIGVDKETSSTRAVIFFKTAPSKWHPQGKEFVRTDRTDSDEGKALARLAQSLVGHKVYVNVAVEGTGEVKVRVIRGIEDNGIDPAYSKDDVAFQPDYVGETAAEKSALEKLVPKLQTRQPKAA